ncbi:DUF6456 domain-containing protein [Brevundimonas sp.]|uniref:DUF6456 domain-containing protein n=1 Tax=Brevundimonas sp. TaxID=1871086 RepID=UPI00391A15D6
MSDRLRALLVRPGAWIEAAPEPGRYRLRLSPDRRRRPVLTLDEATFRELAREPGLAVREGGGWKARSGAVPPRLSAGGRPGFMAGTRAVPAPDGTMKLRAVNLGESPILWLARRKDVNGRPWLSPAEVAAGEKLRTDAELASLGPSLTMRWDAWPRAGAGQGTPSGPGERALSARRRVQAALDAATPGRRAMLERICIHGSSLQLAEQGLGLRRRQGKTVLKQALADLARHYGIG